MQPKRSNTMERYIATSYVSAPKGEDVILSASHPHLSVLVLADGASTLGLSGGQITGGGREAAMIAAHTAITSLTSTLSIPRGLEGMLSALACTFCEARSALERHNATARTPGATTLLTAILCQAEKDGRWFWLHGSLGNGVLSLLQTNPLLSGWPVHTPLLSQQSSGITTITLPGDRAQGYQPSLGVRPHTPGGCDRSIPKSHVV
jgi:hypothetical protein